MKKINLIVIFLSIWYVNIALALNEWYNDYFNHTIDQIIKYSNYKYSFEYNFLESWNSLNMSKYWIRLLKKENK